MTNQPLLDLAYQIWHKPVSNRYYVTVSRSSTGAHLASSYAYATRKEAEDWALEHQEGQRATVSDQPVAVHGYSV